MRGVSVFSASVAVSGTASGSAVLAGAASTADCLLSAGFTAAGAVTYLGATPDGTALGFSLIRDTENGPEWVAFSAALKLDYRIDCLILTPLSGQNPLTNETVPLVLTHSYG